MRYSRCRLQNSCILLCAATWSAIRAHSLYITSSWPSFAAMCSAVYMSLVGVSTAAPCCSSSMTMSMFPNREAMWSGVCCSYKKIIKGTHLLKKPSWDSRHAERLDEIQMRRDSIGSSGIDRHLLLSKRRRAVLYRRRCILICYTHTCKIKEIISAMNFLETQRE